MAVDPVTIIKAAEVAINTVKNEDSRKVIVGMIVGIIAVILIVLAIPVYILEQPLEFLGDIFGVDTDDYSAAESLKENYDDIVLPDNIIIME